MCANRWVMNSFDRGSVYRADGRREAYPQVAQAANEVHSPLGRAGRREPLDQRAEEPARCRAARIPLFCRRVRLRPTRRWRSRRCHELEEQLASGRSPFPRAESFGVHDLIDPRSTRPALCDWLDWVQPLLRDHVGTRSHTIRP